MGKDYESLDTLFADDEEDGAVTIVRNSASSSGGHNSDGDRTLVEKLLKMTDDDDEEDEDYTDSGEPGEGDGEVEDEGEEADEAEGADAGEGAAQAEVKEGEDYKVVATEPADDADQEEEEDEDEDSDDEDDDELPSDVESEIEEDELQQLLQEAEEDLGSAGVTTIIAAQSESSEGLPQRTLRKRTMTAAGVPSGAPVSSSSSSEYQLTHSLEPEGEADVDKPLAVIKHGVVRVGRVVRFIQTHAPDAIPESVLSSQDKAMEEVLSVPLPSEAGTDTAPAISATPSTSDPVPIHHDSTAPSVEPVTAALPLPLQECRWEVTYRKKGDDDDDDDEEVKSEAAPAPVDIVELSYSELRWAI